MFGKSASGDKLLTLTKIRLGISHPWILVKCFLQNGHRSDAKWRNGMNIRSLSARVLDHILFVYEFLIPLKLLTCNYMFFFFPWIYQPSVTTNEIDKAVHQMIIDAGAYPSPLGYGGFPKSVCTSVNECMCHGIPDSRQLQVVTLKCNSLASTFGVFFQDKP